VDDEPYPEQIFSESFTSPLSNIHPIQ